MTDIYTAPAALLTEHPSDDHGALERAVAGNYAFEIGATLNEAWTKTAGAKWKIHLGFALYLAITVAMMLGIGLVAGMLAGVATLIGNQQAGLLAVMFSSLLPPFAIGVLTTPMLAGIYMMGIRRAVDAPFGPPQVIAYFHRMLPLFITYLLMMVLIIIGTLLFVLPGIYLAVAYSLALPLVVEKNFGPWQALETSRRAVSRRWFAVFGFGLLLGLINFVAMMPLMLGLIWSVPLSVIAYGILYRNVFGVAAVNRI